MQSLFTLSLVGSFGELVLMGGTLWQDTLCWVKVGREGGGVAEFAVYHHGTPSVVSGNNAKLFLPPDSTYPQ